MFPGVTGQTFLLEMFQLHVHATSDKTKVLNPESLEWAVIMHVFKTTRFRKQIADIVNEAFNLVAQNKAEVMVVPADKVRIHDSARYMVTLTEDRLLIYCCIITHSWMELRLTPRSRWSTTS